MSFLSPEVQAKALIAMVRSATDDAPIVLRISRLIEAQEAQIRAAHREEKALGEVTDQRDAAEEALSQAYYLITGRSPEWSNAFGHAEALEGVDDAQTALRAEIERLRGLLKEAGEHLTGVGACDKAAADLSTRIREVLGSVGIPPSEEPSPSPANEPANRPTEPPPVDRNNRVLSTGEPVPDDGSHTELRPNGQQRGYIVLSDTERAKGFVRPFRDTYRHKACGKITTMGRSIAETYARDPYFYSGTFCTHCKAHFPIGDDGEFTWYEMDGREGPMVGT